MKRILTAILGLLLAGTASANTYLDLKSGLKLLLPSGQKYYKQELTLTPAQAKTLNSRWTDGGYLAGDGFTLYYTKDDSGKVTGMAMEMTEVILKYSSSHRWLIALKPDLTLAGVAMLEITNDHAYSLATKGFQAQFPGKDPKTLRLGQGIDALTGATDSCQLVIDSAQKVVYLVGQYPPQ